MAEPLFYLRASGFLILIAVTLYFVFDSLNQLYKVLKKGKPSDRWGDWNKRFSVTMKGVFGQNKLLKNPAGIGHFVIFYGFIFITLISIEVFLRAFFPNFSFSFLGSFYLFLLWMEDIISVAVLISLFIGFIRRYVIKPIRFKEKFEHSPGLNKDATLILVMVGIHIIFATILESLEIVAHKHPVQQMDTDFLPPIAGVVAGMWSGESKVLEETIWWLHTFSVWLFLIYIFGSQIRVPRMFPSKHFHILAAPINVIFSNLKPKGRLVPINFEDESIEEYGVNKVEDFNWHQMLDLYACTGCGRCQELCPAFLNDQPLSPRALILNLRENLLEKATVWKNDPEGNVEKDFIGGVVPKETLWACTTCGACQDACPVYIEHIDKIVDMRRSLVMMESEFPDGLDNVFNNIETNYNPWGIGKSDRDLWAAELDIKRMKEHPDTDVLFWVGCAGSFDDRAKKVSTSMVKIFRSANIDFAILGKEEKCTGDPVRRIGNEYLAQDLMTQNVELLNSYNFKEVVTFCPHCFNNLQNELPDFGGHYRVIHAVDYVAQLLRESKLKLNT
ncbi:MAG: (Fe-S)-binding protein, partial [Candidatus Heimdallarchaeota archaeon]|nr:(Fe-S)-binding protein [Candidatus Heimdallarchaeota archaeon]